MPDESNVQDQVAAMIASAGTAEFKPVEIAPVEAAASDANSEKEVVASEQTAKEDKPAEEGEVKQDEATEVKADAKTMAPVRGADGKFVPAEKPVEDKAVEPEAKVEAKVSEEDLMREALGLPKTEPETAETIKERYEASSREAHRLVSESKAQAAALADAGVELVRMPDGKFGLKASQKYLDALKDEQLPNVYAKLGEEDKSLVAEEVAKKIVKMALAEALPKRPMVNATGADAVLPQEVTDKSFSDLAEQKLSNGQPRFPDITEEATVKFMRELYDRPSMAGMRSWMNQSEENFKEGLSLLHASVFRVRAPLLAAKRDAEAALKQEKEKLKKKPSTVASGSGITPDAMRNKGTPSGADSAAAIAAKIAGAQVS